MKSAGVFFIKCVIFTTVFWSLWLFVFRPISNSTSEQAAAPSSENTQQSDTDALMRKYWAQAAQADKLQETSIAQLNHYDAALKKQDELLSRWEKVIQKWEHTGSKQ